MRGSICLVILILTGCTSASSSEEDTISVEEFQKALDEAYNLGYVDGLEAEKQEKETSITPTFSSGLSLMSDGLDWKFATEIDKKDFIRSLANSGEVRIYVSQIDNYVDALDVYYGESGNGLKTLKEAIEEIEGSY
ncbi:hypothetical protein [Bacillus litorisediminis]|uniref:hypothetical protein n=1 Tax=Bacillus litorisediminis TaxID=2922713 RepID=UPI001FABF820|nr:hypothetical protein [Bacillus litorisediminis]